MMRRGKEKEKKAATPTTLSRPDIAQVKTTDECCSRFFSYKIATSIVEDESISISIVCQLY